MHYLVNPLPVSGGIVTVPGDKSISHRALMLGAIAAGDTSISGFLPGEDCKATLSVLRAMGVRIDEQDATQLTVRGVGLQGLQEPPGELDLQNSGTGMRLFAGLLCGQQFSTTLVGDASLTRRPMGRVIEPLERMGAVIDSRDGLPPLEIAGGHPLTGIDYRLPVASAQVKSAVLLATLYAKGETRVVEPAPTRDHTERMLQSMGVKLTVEAGQIRLSGSQTLRSGNIDVPADLSSAAFLILAMLLGGQGEVVLERIGINPTRCGVLEILQQMGARIEIENRRMLGFEPVADLRVTPSRLHGVEVSPALVSLAIDEFPVLFIAAAAARGRSRFSGIGELRVKESDRISAMAQGLRRLGIEVVETQDGAEVQGGAFSGGEIDSHGDHRVAMSFTVAGTIAAGPVKVLQTDAVETSFPGFIECLRALGADVSVEHSMHEAQGD